MIKKTTLFLIPFLFIACSTKESLQKENLTALSWHYKIYRDIQNSRYDQADNDFMSLEAEHPGSIYIKTDLLALYLAHMKNKEYVLAKFYINEYEKRFASQKDIPWIEYQKIKLDFLKYNNAYTNQEALLSLIKESKHYLLNYPNSQFKYEVETILAKAELTNKYLDEQISRLYKKLNKPEAAKMYEVKVPANSKPPVVPWYKKLFYW